jgi:hypothetical protein
MAHGYDKRGVEAGGTTLPPHDQAPVLPLEPGKRPLNVVARDVLSDRAAARRFGLPSAFGKLGSDPTAAEATTEVFGIIPFIRRDDLEPFARSAPFAGAAALLGAQGGPRGRSHQRPPVIRMESHVFTTLRKGAGGLPRPRFDGSGGNRSAKRFHSKSLHPSHVPALVLS